MSEARRYNTGKLRWMLMDFEAMEPMIRVLMYGAHKYTIFEGKDGKHIRGVDISPEEAKGLKIIESGSDNWKAGLDYVQLLECNQRHQNAIARGEDIDPESGLPHIGHKMCNDMFLSWMMLHRPDLDNRYSTLQKKKND